MFGTFLLIFVFIVSSFCVTNCYTCVGFFFLCLVFLFLSVKKSKYVNAVEWVFQGSSYVGSYRSEHLSLLTFGGTLQGNAMQVLSLALGVPSLSLVGLAISLFFKYWLIICCLWLYCLCGQHYFLYLFSFPTGKVAGIMFLFYLINFGLTQLDSCPMF